MLATLIPCLCRNRLPRTTAGIHQTCQATAQQAHCPAGSLPATRAPIEDRVPATGTTNNAPNSMTSPRGNGRLLGCTGWHYCHHRRILTRQPTDLQTAPASQLSFPSHAQCLAPHCSDRNRASTKPVRLSKHQYESRKPLPWTNEPPFEQPPLDKAVTHGTHTPMSHPPPIWLGFQIDGT